MYQKYTPSLPLISIHVPRTGGTSVQNCLAEWFGSNFYTHYVDEAVQKAPTPHRLAPGTCVHGHFNKYRGFGVRDYYAESRQWIIFLRDPFERHISLFFYLRKHEHQYFFAGRPVPVSVWRSFDDFLNFLADNRGDIQGSFANTFLAHFPMETDDQPPNAILSEFIHVGITEYLDQSLRLLAAKLGRKLLHALRLNAAERTLGWDIRLHDRHEQLFPLEHGIYRIASAEHAHELALFRQMQAAPIF